jgi:CheY-like chemotaxis protein
MANVLVIDDEDQLRDLLSQMLVRDGHIVKTACDGVDGMNMIKEFQPDLVITDIIMPNKDGITVIIELLNISPSTPVIAISGGRRAVTASFNLESAELLGVKGILAKPFTRDELRKAIEIALA